MKDKGEELNIYSMQSPGVEPTKQTADVLTIHYSSALTRSLYIRRYLIYGGRELPIKKITYLCVINVRLIEV